MCEISYSYVHKFKIVPTLRIFTNSTYTRASQLLIGFWINKSLCRNNRGESANGCGGRTRTCDLVVMSHASCRCSTPRRMVWKLYQTEVVMSTRGSVLSVLAVQEKINPRLEIALVGRLFGFRAVGLGRTRQVDGVSQRHARRHDDLFFAGRGQAEVLAG